MPAVSRRTTALLGAAAGVVGAVAAYDLRQRRHAILRNYPVLGHFRYWLEAIGPELRQYIVTDNDQERPFTRDHRRWIYTTAKSVNTYFGFGTDNDLENAEDYLIVKHAAMAPPPVEGPLLGDADVTDGEVPCAKVLGAAHGRAQAFRPASIVNISAMSFGSLSGAAIEALNRGAALSGCLHNTGEGGLSPHHLHGGDLVWQIGTGYFGCRDGDGRFVLEAAIERAATAPVRAIELKLSQGAKAGLGGLVPGAKVTREIADLRGIPVGRDCLSPPFHTAFSDVDSMIDVLEALADGTGLPVGIKAAVGQEDFWAALVDRMATRGEGPDFITIDGGEGGSGAAPLAFADHVGLPFFVGFPRVYTAFAEAGVADDVVFIGSGKLGFPQSGMLALALGCDLVNVAREAMMAIGCIQAQRCHTGRCPTGVATQSPWLERGLDPSDKAVRVAGYLGGFRKELIRLGHACGQPHPAFVPLEDLELVDHRTSSVPAPEAFGYEPGWGLPPVARH